MSSKQNQDVLTHDMLTESMLDMGNEHYNENEMSLEEQKNAANSKLLAICFVLMVVIGLGNKIFQILMQVPMNNYPLFLSLYTTAVYVPVSFAYIFPMLKWGTLITREQTELPKKSFFYMGALDALAGIMQTIAINYIANGTLVILIVQMAIPISMIISALLLGTKYKIFQYFGCVVVAAGLAVVLVPKFLNPAEDSDISTMTLLFSILGLVASNIPMCLSSVVKEKALGEASIDPVYLNGWIALFQFFMSFPLLIPAAPTANVELKDLVQNLIDGAKCYVGINTYVAAPLVESVSQAVPLSSTFFDATLTHASHFLGALGDRKTDDCAMSPYYVNIYLVFNILYNILIIMIIKYGSSNILWLAMTVMVPLGSISFSLKFMPNPKELKSTDIIGLCVILTGLLIYRFWESVRSLCIKEEEPDWAEAEPLTLNNDGSDY